MSPPPPGEVLATLDATPPLPEVFRSVRVPQSGHFWRKLGAFSGPGYLVAVGYMDPGNWATDLAGGAKYGYTLLAAILLSNLLAVFLQTLSLRLGIASGRDLAQLCRDRFSMPVALALWVAAELSIVACDLAEVIGAAIALQLLFGLPLLAGASVTVLDVFLVLWFQQRGFRYIEALVVSLLLVIGVCLAVDIVLARPEFGAMAAALLPSLQIVTDPGMLYAAIGILGATVMPHNLYLHSAIAQTRQFTRSHQGKAEAIRFGTLDTVTALSLALLINGAILVLATAFHRTGHVDVAEIQDAYRLLSPVLGAGIASVLFGVALLAAGQMSAMTGTLAGQIVMEGFWRRRVSPSLSRLAVRGLAIVPSLIVIAGSGEARIGALLVLSQVVLSLQLTFAVVPLVIFTSDRSLMGGFVNSRLIQLVGIGTATGIAAINVWLLVKMLQA